jgi:hypothetical protein
MKDIIQIDTISDLKTAGLLSLVGEVEPECIPAVCQFARIVSKYLKMKRIGANH